VGVNIVAGSRSSPAAFAIVSRGLIPSSAWLTVVIALLIAASLLAVPFYFRKVVLWVKKKVNKQ